MKRSTSKTFNYTRSLVAILGTGAVCLVGCQSRVTPEQNTLARQAIASATSDFQKAFAQTNSVAIASQYMDDGELLLASDETIRDRDNIAEFFGNFLLQTGATKIQFNAAQFHQLGSFANETGTFVTSTPDGRTVLDGDYIAIWRLVGAQWKIQVQAFNPTRPQGHERGMDPNQPHGLVRS